MYVYTNALGSFSGGENKEQILDTFKKAMILPQAARWKVASDKDITSLEKHGVYELIPITSVPNERKVIGTRWVHKSKADGVYKGRLAVLGWSKVPRIDCGGTFAPVRRLQSIQMILTMAVELDYEVYILDVKRAFLNADDCFNDWGGRAYDDSVPGRSLKQYLPGIGLHDPLHGR